MIHNLEKGYTEANWPTALFVKNKIGFEYDIKLIEAHSKKASAKHLENGIFVRITLVI
jgi:hypothetical protein